MNVPKRSKPERKREVRVSQAVQSNIEPGLRTPFKCNLAMFARTYLVYSQATKSLRTYQADRDAIRDFERVIGNIRLAAIKVEHLEQFRLERLKAIKPSSVNVALRHLKAAFSWATEHGYLTDNPARKVRLCRVPRNLHPRFLSEEEVARLRQATQEDPEFAPMLEILLLTGLRRNELAHLRWQDVDLGRGVITVQNHGDYQTKSGKSRIIPICVALRRILTDLRTHAIDGDRVCTVPYGSLGHRFRRAAQRAGLDPSFSLHTLRHTFASHLVMQGVDLPSVQAILGHHDVKTTMIYSHLSPEHLARTVEKLPY